MEDAGRTVIPWGTAKVHVLDETVEQQTASSLVNAIAVALSVHGASVASGKYELHIACEGTATSEDIGMAEQFCAIRHLHLRTIGDGEQRVFVIEA